MNVVGLIWPVTTLVLFGVACGDKPGGTTGADSGAHATALDTEDKTWDFEAFKVKGKVPTGWSESQLGPGFTYKKPGRTFGTMLRVTPSCEGSCGSIADNIKKAAAEQVKMHKASGYEATIVSDAELANGRMFELTVRNSDEAFRSAHVFAFAPAWQEALSCDIQADPEDDGLYDGLIALCKGLAVTPK
ncbi:MAG: hypothetical protein IT373_37420 [Polyangiaceae bacterium]|nr:hypothetical protein [Polyangiaceae bacterium]